ncbi:MAG: Na+/H+ antiporter subunit C [Gammaproteobacteria bacterium]|nr:MAG: Na+/H+ antiporter subunit C [Gammaproteobacteria bacterium]
MSIVGGLYTYWVVIALMMCGLYIMMARYNLVKKIIGLGLFQTSIFYLYVAIGNVTGGEAPILTGEENTVYSNPLPHVLILTAIVVGVATAALALALIVRIHEEFGTMEDDELKAIERTESDI